MGGPLSGLESLTLIIVVYVGLAFLPKDSKIGNTLEPFAANVFIVERTTNCCGFFLAVLQH